MTTTKPATLSTMKTGDISASPSGAVPCAGTSGRVGGGGSVGGGPVVTVVAGPDVVVDPRGRTEVVARRGVVVAAGAAVVGGAVCRVVGAAVVGGGSGSVVGTDTWATAGVASATPRSPRASARRGSVLGMAGRPPLRPDRRRRSAR